jgi:6-phosphogluconolactonase (cycloisomerase 2 family)
MATRKLALRALSIIAPCAVASCGSDSTPAPSSTSIPAAPTYAVGGTVTGLQGAGLVLELNGSDDLAVSSDGSFGFARQLQSGQTYSVTIKSQPTLARELCVASSASGTLVIGNVSNIAIQCSMLLGYVYAVTAPHENLIVTYGIVAATGALLPTGTPVLSGVYPTSMVVTPSGSSLYISNFGFGTILSYSIDAATGALTPVGSPISAGANPSSMVVAPSGRFLYVADTTARVIDTYAIDPTTGELTSSGAPLSVASYGNGGNGQFAITPDGKHLYTVIDCGCTTSPSLAAFNVDTSTGVLTAGVTLAVTGTVFGMTMDPRGQFLYLLQDNPTGPQGPPNIDSSLVTPYQIDATTGALTNPGVSTTVPGSVGDLAVNPDGALGYTIDGFNATAQDDHVSAFQVRAPSNLWWSVGADQETLGIPLRVICDPSSQFVFVANTHAAGADPWYDVVSYQITDNNANPSYGELTPAGLGTQVPADESGQALIAVVE